MTYNTPELLTIGAAQNLILAGLGAKSPGELATNCDDAEEYVREGILDASSW